jgi:phage shock protein A
MTPLNIEKTIYPDRFMIENREKSEKLRKNVTVLRDKIKHLEKSLDEYKSF